jgi:hypothetical protein
MARAAMKHEIETRTISFKGALPKRNGWIISPFVESGEVSRQVMAQLQESSDEYESYSDKRRGRWFGRR